jgi:S-DNA-T family DNA segregation ATPase FtsK/SpoIIIE
MPLVNVMQGQSIPEAPINVRTPFIRIPIWLALVWWAVKGLARLVLLACRYWYLTGPAVVLLWLYADYGWYGPVGLLAGLTLTAGGWGVGHRPSFLRFGWFPAVGRWRRLVYRRRWYAAMATAKLAVSFDTTTVLPVLKRVRSRPGCDLVLVHMVTGQIPDDYVKVSERLAHTFGVRAVKTMPGPKVGTVVLALLRGDSLTAVVAPFPVVAVPDFTALPLGRQEDGGLYCLRLFGTQVLIVGATGAGKGSVIWSIIRALSGGVACGLVELWAFDPKGGMELGGGKALFARFARRGLASMADMLDEALTVAQARADRLAGQTRQHIPSRTEPLIVIVIDELAALTAYVTDRKLKDRIKATLGELLTQGRAVGVHVVAALQDPRKDALPFRNLFPTRIGLRLSEEAEVDMTLGEGIRDRGALCDRIPESAPGVGYVVLDGNPTPMRVRFSYLTDEHITDLARDYGRLRLIGDQTGGAA